jgi:hypothetical protein
MLSKNIIVLIVMVVGLSYLLVFVSLILALHTGRVSPGQIAVMVLYGVLASAVMALLLWVARIIVPAIDGFGKKDKSDKDNRSN